MELERGQRLEYGCPLRRVRRQANGLAYASTLGWMRVEPQQRNAHPSEEDQSGSMNPRDFSRGESQQSLGSGVASAESIFVVTHAFNRL